VSSHANGYIIQVGWPKKKKEQRTTVGAIIGRLSWTYATPQGTGRDSDERKILANENPKIDETDKRERVEVL
jgi:hypothetical protein